LGGLYACGATFQYMVPLPNIFLIRLFSKTRLKRKDFREKLRLPWAQEVPSSNLGAPTKFFKYLAERSINLSEPGVCPAETCCRSFQRSWTFRCASGMSCCSLRGMLPSTKNPPGRILRWLRLQMRSIECCFNRNRTPRSSWIAIGT